MLALEIDTNRVGGGGKKRLPLLDYNVFRTTSIEEARAEVAQLFCPHDLSVVADIEQFEAVHNCAPLGARANSTRLNFLSYGAAVNISPVPLTDFFLVNIPLSGSADVFIGSRVFAGGPSRPYILNPTDHVRLRWAANTSHLVVRLDRARMEERLATLLGRTPVEPLSFTTSMDSASQRVRSWLRCATLAREELDYPNGLWREEAIRAQFEEMLITGLLFAQPNNYSDVLSADQSPAPPRLVRAAITYIRANLHRPVTVLDIAESVGGSVRALQIAFRRHLDTTPMEYLRALRLEHAHNDLRDADAEQGTAVVTEICFRWGFTHQGRFASAYRQKYGVTPSQTFREGAGMRRAS